MLLNNILWFDLKAIPPAFLGVRPGGGLALPVQKTLPPFRVAVSWVERSCWVVFPLSTLRVLSQSLLAAAFLLKSLL